MRLAKIGNTAGYITWNAGGGIKNTRCDLALSKLAGNNRMVLYFSMNINEEFTSSHLDYTSLDDNNSGHFLSKLDGSHAGAWCYWLDSELPDDTSTHIYRCGDSDYGGWIGNRMGLAVAVELYDVDQDYPFGTVVQNAAASLDVTAIVGNLVIDGTFDHHNRVDLVPEAGQDLVRSYKTGGFTNYASIGISSKLCTANPVTMDWTNGAHDKHFAVGIVGALSSLGPRMQNN